MSKNVTLCFRFYVPQSRCPKSVLVFGLPLDVSGTWTCERFMECWYRYLDACLSQGGRRSIESVLWTSQEEQEQSDALVGWMQTDAAARMMAKVDLNMDVDHLSHYTYDRSGPAQLDLRHRLQNKHFVRVICALFKQKHKLELSQWQTFLTSLSNFLGGGLRLWSTFGFDREAGVGWFICRSQEEKEKLATSIRTIGSADLPVKVKL